MSNHQERKPIINDQPPILQQLYEATDACDVQKVKLILARNLFLDLNQSVEPYGMTLLHLAVGHECVDIVKILLAHHSDPNSRAGDDKLTPLHLSVYCQNVDIFKLLFKAGGDLKLENGNGFSCMDLIEMDADVREAFLGAMVLENKSTGSSSTTKQTPVVAAHLAPIVSEPSRIPSSCQMRIVPPSSTLTHIPVPAMSTSGNSTFYSCVSSNTQKPNSIPNSSQIESLSATLNDCNISEMPTQISSSPSLSSSTGEGISDQSTNPLMSDVTFSILAPTSMPASRTQTFKLEILSETPADSCYDTSQSSCSSTSTKTGPHCTSSADCSCCSSVAPTPVLTESQLDTVRATAVAHGLPVLPSTIGVLSKFVNTQSHTVKLSPPKTSFNGYSMELDYLIRNIDLINQWQGLQVEFLQNFTTPKKTSKSFFNYLLLDPYLLKRTNFSGNYLRTGLLQNPEKFHAFIKSIFYVGKGTANRPLQHLVEAKNVLTSKERHQQRSLEDNSKVDKVLSIWKKGQGIIVLSLFHHSPELEANANEAAIIDSIGLGCSQLTNIKKGSYLNTPAAKWSQKTKNQFGACLLHKAYCAFVVSGSSLKSFYPKDV